MLGKLLKYEFKASSRLFLLLYAALMVVTIINLSLDPLQNLTSDNSAISTVVAVISGFFMFSYVILIIAVAVITIVMIITRFYKNLMGDEGYLMFTLPVSADSQILSKLIVSVVWSLLSFLVVLISILILTVRIEFFETISQTFDQMQAMGFNIGAWIAGFVVTLIIYFICVILTFYGAIAIGANLTKNRLLGSFLGYLILYTITQIIGLISVFIVYASGMFSNLEEYAGDSIPMGSAVDFTNTMGIQIFLYINILNLVVIALFYLTTRYFIKNKLNLA